MNALANANATLSIDMDTVLEDETFEGWSELLAAKGVTTKLITMCGPSGWPLIAYSGTEAALRAVLREHFLADSDAGETSDFYLFGE